MMNEIPTSPRKVGRFRSVTLWSATILGLLQLILSLLWMVAGAGMYGSPLSHGGPWVQHVLFFLATGPMALFPGAVLAFWSRRLGGTFLVLAGLLSTVAAIIVMDPLQPGHGVYYPGNESVLVYTMKWAIMLILPFSLPMLLLGLGLLWSSRSTNRSDVTEP